MKKKQSPKKNAIEKLLAKKKLQKEMSKNRQLKKLIKILIEKLKK